ncbi:MAG TPA: hypothetical protein DIT64_21000 [Verrucomicrobiales bacterium]|nr:hypothetical protein [Verrucomicrobiales bacterium]
MPRLPATLCLIVCLHTAARAQTFEDTLGLRTEWITLDEAVGRVLENSLDVRIERLNWAVSERQTEAAWAKFDPAWFMNSTWRDASLPQNTLDFVQTGGGFVALDEPNIFRQQSLLSQAGFEGLLPTGTQYRLFAGAGEFRNDLNRQRPPAIFYPEYAAAAGGTITQPLLRGFGLGVNLAEVRVGRKNQEIALRQWEARLQRSVAQVVTDYFDLIFAVEDLEVKRGVTAFARRLVLENQKRLEAGQLSPADVQEAEVAVAVSREEVIAALGFAVEKQRSLKTQILGSMHEGEGVVFLPRDSLPVIAPRTDRAPLLATALQRRPDHRAALEEAEKQEIIVKYARNQRLPRLDLQATLTANGLSGGRSDAFERAFDRQGYDAQAGFQFSIPLGNRAARANEAAAAHRREQAVLNIARSELGLGVELDSGLAQVGVARARAESTRESARLAERLLETEEKRLAEGVARTFDVLRARQALADARTRQIAAQADYNKAAVQLALITGTVLDRHGIRVEAGAEPRAVRGKN